MIEQSRPGRAGWRSEALPMNEHSMTTRPGGLWLSVWVTTVLSAAAAFAVIIGAALAIGSDDTEPLESPLMLPIARQLLRGPTELYGPFNGQNPLVLIHAPLYYHLSALLAWPLYGAGYRSVFAARVAGRSLSFLGLLATLAAVYLLARLDGAPRVVGWWSVLLVAAAPVVGVMPYTVRPDMLGVALQTTGVLLVLSVLRSQRPSSVALYLAFAAFGAAACVKQTFVVTALISTVFLLPACWRGRLSFTLVARGLLIWLAIVLVVYGIEDLVTGGRMAQAVFEAPASASRLHPGDWLRAWIVVFTILGQSSGLLALLMAAGLAGVAARHGIGRMALVAAGTCVTALIVARTTSDLVGRNMTGWDNLLPFINVGAALFVVIPVCHLLSPQTFVDGRLDRALWIYMAAELGLVWILIRASTGAWINYGIQLVIFASIVTARALGRGRGCATSPIASLPIALAALVVLIAMCVNAKLTYRRYEVDRLALQRIFAHYDRPSSEFFFVDRPGQNRVYGQLELVYDHWLYPVFESNHLAEPRSNWLRRELTSDRIHFIVNIAASNRLDGLGESLPELGYVPGIQVGSMYVWRRARGVSVPDRR